LAESGTLAAALGTAALAALVALAGLVALAPVVPLATPLAAAAALAAPRPAALAPSAAPAPTALVAGLAVAVARDQPGAAVEVKPPVARIAWMGPLGGTWGRSMTAGRVVLAAGETLASAPRRKTQVALAALALKLLALVKPAHLQGTGQFPNWFLCFHLPLGDRLFVGWRQTHSLYQSLRAQTCR